MPSVQIKCETSSEADATNKSACERCNLERLECTYGETERNWQGRQRYVPRDLHHARIAILTQMNCRSYGPLSELNQRLYRLESNLLAKLGEAGLPATQLKVTEPASTTADALIGSYADDQVAQISAAFQFETAVLPADPGNSTAYGVGFMDASKGRSYLSRMVTGLNTSDASAAFAHHPAEGTPSPAPSKVSRRRPSLASSVSTVPSDVTEPRTPAPSSGRQGGFSAAHFGCDGGRHSFVESPGPLSHGLTEPPEAQQYAFFPRTSSEIHGASPGASSDPECGVPKSRTTTSGPTLPPPFGPCAIHTIPFGCGPDLSRFDLSPSIPYASPPCAHTSGLSQPSLFSF